MRPAEGVDRGEDLVGRSKESGGRVGRAVVKEDVQRDAVAGVVGGRKGAEAAEERGGAVVGEEFDEEGEVARVRGGACAVGGEERCGLRGAAEQEEDGQGDGEDEEEEREREGAAARRRHWVLETAVEESGRTGIDRRSREREKERD